MKTRSAVPAVLAAVCILAVAFPSAAATAAGGDNAALDAVVQANNSFAPDFYRQMARQNGSLSSRRIAFPRRLP
ncbi:MAG: hypothetical protein ACM3ZU_12875 [Bacteroidota bacterium]